MFEDGEEHARQLADLSREVTETRNQMIKTANVVSNLAGDVREVSRQWQQIDRGRKINSIVAYLVFMVLIAGGFYFTYQARRERVELEKEILVRQHAAAQNKLREMDRREELRKEGEKKAYAFYQLIEARKVHRAIEEYPTVQRLPLSKVERAVFRDWVDRNRNRLAYQSYSAGMRLVGEKSWHRAAAEFRRSLSLVTRPPHAAPLHYYLGVALMKLGNYTEAADAMQRAVSFDAERQVSREVRYHLGTIFEQLGKRREAQAAYREYIKRYPGTNYARAARRRLKQLE